MRASTVFVCIVFALSCVNAEYLVKKGYAESSTCSSSSFSAAGVWNTNQCFSVGTDYNKYTISGNKVTLYSECDSLCKTCGSNDGTYTLNACNTETVDGDTNSFSFYTSAKVPTDWSSEPTRVMYGNTQCTGDWAAILIDASEDSCPFISSQEGLCTTNDQYPGSSFKPYCSMPSDINGGGKPTTKPSTPSSPAFDLNGYFVVTSLYDSSSCSGKPVNATIQPPGTCWNMMDILSVKYDINNGQVTEYFCSGSDCSSDCTIIPVPLDTCISDDIEKKRSTLLKAKKQALGISEDDSVYGSISIVKGFPTSITKGKTLVVAYDQTTCKGSPTQMSTLDTPCVETCTLLGKSFCSYDSFAKTIPKKLGGKEGSSSMVVIIVVVVVLVAVAAIIGAVVAFVVRRRKHGHHHSVNDHHDYRPLMQGDHHHGDHH